MRFWRAVSSLASVSSLFFVQVSRAAEDPCRIIGELAADYPEYDNSIFTLKQARDCLQNIPFDAERSLDLVEQVRLYGQFLSTQIYFINPPTDELELAAVDFNSTLEEIKTNISSNIYANDFEFNTVLTKLFASFRDGHTQFIPACMGMFQYYHNYSIVSIASDVETNPEIWHATVDTDGVVTVKRKISKINGTPVVEYLTNLTQTLPDLAYADPDARWNALMIQVPWVSGTGVFARRGSWEAAENITITWDDGKETVVEWLATFADGFKYTLSSNNIRFDSTQTMMDRICFWSDSDMEVRSPAVMGPRLYQGNSTLVSERSPAITSSPTVDEISHKETMAALKPRTVTASSTASTETILGYPVAKSRGPEDVVSFYSLDDDSSIAVMALKSFDSTSNDINFILTFYDYFKSYVQQLKSSGVEKLIIDISGNMGGYAVLPYLTVKYFFPDVDTFSDVNWRYSPALADFMKVDGMQSNEFFTPGTFNKTDGTPYSDVEQLLGPVYVRGDYFTTLSEQDYAEMILMSWPDFNLTFGDEAAFDKDNIVIVSNGMCASSCHNFVEEMVQRGVRSYSFGGRPSVQWMQAVGGTKGGYVTPFDTILESSYKLLGDTSDITYMPKPFRTKMSVATVNAVNYFRPGQEQLPLDFMYTPSCRKLSLTKDMVNDVTKVWAAAKAAAWDNDGNARSCEAFTGIPAATFTSLGQNIWRHVRWNAEDPKG